MNTIRTRLEKLEKRARSRGVFSPGAVEEPMTDDERIRRIEAIWRAAENGDPDAIERKLALMALDEVVRLEGMARLPTTAYQPQGVTG